MIDSWICTSQFTTKREFPKSYRIKNSVRYLQVLCIPAQ
jgi:predicted DNA-binding transcriptional regulator AlpA